MQSPVSVLSSGSLNLDLALQIGGFPRGQIVEIVGPDSSGKTTLCLSILAVASNMGEKCAYFDADLSLTQAYARACDVDTENLYVAQSSNCEAILDMIETLARSGGVQVIVLDSASSLIQNREIRTALGETQPVENDRLLARALNRLAPVLERNQSILLITNTEYPRRAGSIYHQLAPHMTRLALKLHAGVRLHLSPGKLIKQDEQVIGESVQIRVLKNQFSPGRPSLKLDIMYNDGIIKYGELMDLGVQLAVIRLENGIYVYRDQNLGEGYSQGILSLKSNPKLSQEIYQDIRQKLFPAARFIFPLFAAKA